MVVKVECLSWSECVYVYGGVIEVVIDVEFLFGYGVEYVSEVVCGVYCVVVKREGCEWKIKMIFRWIVVLYYWIILNNYKYNG